MYAQSKRPIMAVIHLYSLTGKLDQVTDIYQFRLLNWKILFNFTSWSLEFVK